MRNRSEPGQVVRAGFEPGRIAVTQRVIGCYCASARSDGSGRFKIKKLEPPKEKRRKAGQNERPNREGHEGWAGRVKNFRVSAMLKTTPPGCERKQPESEEARPVASGERAVKSGGRPGANGGDAKENHRRVSTWFAGWWRNHQLKRAEKPHSKFSDRKALDGPATRPETPLAVENGVGKPAAPRGRA
jgi:hypothetical protein